MVGDCVRSNKPWKHCHLQSGWVHYNSKAANSYDDWWCYIYSESISESDFSERSMTPSLQMQVRRQKALSHYTLTNYSGLLAESLKTCWAIIVVRRHQISCFWHITVVIIWFFGTLTVTTTFLKVFGGSQEVREAIFSPYFFPNIRHDTLEIHTNKLQVIPGGSS